MKSGQILSALFAWENFVKFWEVSTIAKDQTQVNEKIRAKELRLIGQNGDQIGVKSKREALEMAERVELDLVNHLLQELWIMVNINSNNRKKKKK